MFSFHMHLIQLLASIPGMLVLTTSVYVTCQVTKWFSCFGIAGSGQLGLPFGKHLVVCMCSILESVRKEESLQSINGANLPLKKHH